MSKLILITFVLLCVYIAQLTAIGYCSEEKQYYFSYPKRLSRNDALDDCIHRGMHLVKVLSANDQNIMDFYVNLSFHGNQSFTTGDKGIYTSGIAYEGEQEFIWGSPDFPLNSQNYTNWKTGEPNNTGKRCIAFMKLDNCDEQFWWYDVDCKQSMYYLCQSTEI